MKRRIRDLCTHMPAGRFGDPRLLFFAFAVVLLAIIQRQDLYEAFTTFTLQLAQSDSSLPACVNTNVKASPNASNELDVGLCPDFPKASFGSHLTLNSTPASAKTYFERYNRPCVREIDSYPSNHLGANATASTTAVVLRAWDNFTWTDDDIRNVQALISELALLGDEYSVHILLQVKDDPDSVETPQEAKNRLVPVEFANITELWSTSDSRKAYPAVGEYDFYYHAFMALQLFADRHQKYHFFWNWEMDVRFTGHYHTLFPSLSAWAEMQPSNGLWQRNTRFYMPSIHGSFNDFANLTSSSTTEFPEPAPWIPPHLTDDRLANETHLITLFPLFDTTHTAWPHKDYMVHYGPSTVTPRFGTVGTNMRFSRQMLEIMSHENAAGRAMMSEMWPPTLAFHHNLRTVVVHHPMFLDKDWPPDVLLKTFNGGKNGGVGGSSRSVINREHHFLGSTWFWNAQLPLKLYRRWMHADEKDLQQVNARNGHKCGGCVSSKSDSLSSGPGNALLPPMLLHPVKGNLLH